MKKNALNVFERFAQAYFAFVNDNDERYLVRINGITIKEVITSKDELREAVEGALAVNPKSEIEVYKVFNEDLFKEEEVETPVETEDEVVEEVEAPVETEEEAQAAEEAIGDGSEDEALKDLPRKAKSDKKAAKLAKKLKKKEKKAAKKAKEAGYAPVEEWETPSLENPSPEAYSPPEPVVEKKVVKKTTKKTTTTKKAVGSAQGVQQLHLETGAVIKTFDSVSHAAQALGINATNISKVTNGHRKSTGGFGWKKV